MKFIISSLILSILLISCSEEPKINVEDVIYACVLERSTDDGVDLAKLLDEFEAHLIKEKVLTSSEGKSYVAIYEFAIENNKLPSTITNPAQEKLWRFSKPDSPLNSCLGDTTLFNAKDGQDSKLLLLAEQYESLYLSGNISVRTVSEATLAILTADDFELPLYRANALISLAQSMELISPLDMKEPK
ncbi:MAG: hypothetical protein ACI837_001057 [Crocinitomicaceae bacterium]|jgi:hypothetical protein